MHQSVIVCPPVSLLFSRSPICGAGSERLSFTGLDSSSGGLKCWDRKLKSLSSFGRLVPLSVWLQLTTESEFTFTDWKIVQWRRLLVVDDKVLTDCLRSTPIDERGPGGQQSSSAFADVELDVVTNSYLVDPASSHMLVSKIKPCMSKYKPH